MTKGNSVIPQRILFSSEEIGAHLDGRKSQARSVIKWLDGGDYFIEILPSGLYSFGDRVLDLAVPRLAPHKHSPVKCPYGTAGDRLWVAETFAPFIESNTPPTNSPGHGIKYRADDHYRGGFPTKNITELAAKGLQWRPSTNMPSWASRFMLEVTDVRVERLQDISIHDILAEGVISRIPPKDEIPPSMALEYAREYYADYWNLINAKFGVDYESNPWVWVISYGED